MVNEANFSVSGYVATQPSQRFSPDGRLSVSMRVGWTPRRLNKLTGEWQDLPSSFVSVVCFRKVAENVAKCLHKGEPVVLSGTLQVREYTDAKGEKKLSVDVVAHTLGHDLSRGVSFYARVQAVAGLTAEEAARAQATAELAGRDPAAGPAGVPAAGSDQYSGHGGEEDRHADDDLDTDDDPGRPLAELAGLEVPASPEGLSMTAGALA